MTSLARRVERYVVQSSFEQHVCCASSEVLNVLFGLENADASGSAHNRGQIVTFCPSCALVRLLRGGVTRYGLGSMRLQRVRGRAEVEAVARFGEWSRFHGQALDRAMSYRP